MLDALVKRLEKNPIRNSYVEANVRYVIGVAFWNIRKAEAANTQFRLSLNARKKAVGGIDARTAETLNWLGLTDGAHRSSSRKPRSTSANAQQFGSPLVAVKHQWARQGRCAISLGALVGPGQSRRGPRRSRRKDTRWRTTRECCGDSRHDSGMVCRQRRQMPRRLVGDTQSEQVAPPAVKPLPSLSALRAPEPQCDMWTASGQRALRYRQSCRTPRTLSVAHYSCPKASA